MVTVIVTPYVIYWVKHHRTKISIPWVHPLLKEVPFPLDNVCGDKCF